MTALVLELDLLREAAGHSVSQVEAARMLGMSYPALRSAVYEGRIRCVRIGRAIRIPLAEIERILAERCDDPDYDDAA